MNYSEFKEAIVKTLKDKVEARGLSVELKAIVKTNDCVQDGLMLMDENTLAAPTIYLEDFYEFYEEGADVSSIADKIIEIHDKNVDLCPISNFDIENFELSKNKITFKLVNTAINQIYLKDLVHIDYLDLSILFDCTVVLPDGQVMSTRITEEIMKIWHTNKETLLEIAKENTKRILGLFLQEAGEILQDRKENHGPKLYILSNRTGHAGAVNIFLPGVLKDLAEELQDDLYIIPSSIHEVLLVPVSGVISRENIDEMVRDVNKNVLEPKDILSNHSYYYRRLEDKIAL